jgi:hypothetical protein
VYLILFSRKNLLDEDGANFCVDPALLRAVHHIFTVSGRPGDIAPKAVLHLARAFKQVSTVI